MNAPGIHNEYFNIVLLGLLYSLLGSHYWIQASETEDVRGARGREGGRKEGRKEREVEKEKKWEGDQERGKGRKNERKREGIKDENS